jgi:hypothetical protein
MKKLILGIVLLFGINAAKAQSDMVQLLATGKTEANMLITDYASPFLETFGNNLNNGWYSTAAPLKTARFTITIGGTASFVPKDKQSFTINPANYTHLRTTGNVPITAPTVFGEKTSMTDLFAYYSNGGSTIQTPIALKGTGINMSPLPVVQLSVGLIKGTEVMLRIFPKIETGDYKAGYFGFGLKHNIKQWIPFIKDKAFDLSFAGAFASASLDMVGSNFLLAETGVNNPSGQIFNNQTINFSSSAWNANVIISKKLSLLTLFGGVRLSHYKTTLDLKGNYPITTLDNAGNKTITNLADPIGIEGSGTQFGFNGGLRIKLGFLAIFAEGSLVPGGYSSATAGLNIGFFN